MIIRLLSFSVFFILTGCATDSVQDDDCLLNCSYPEYRQPVEETAIDLITGKRPIEGMNTPENSTMMNPALE